MIIFLCIFYRVIHCASTMMFLKKFHMHNKSYAYLIVWFLALHDEGFKDLITQTFHMHYSSYA